MAGIAAMIHGLILAAHTRHPPHLSSGGIILVIGVAILALAVWIVGWYRALRPPTSAEDWIGSSAWRFR